MKTLTKLRKDKRVKSAWTEDGAYWVTLADGWYWTDCDDRLHSLHEETVRELLNALEECRYDANDNRP